MGSRDTRVIKTSTVHRQLKGQWQWVLLQPLNLELSGVFREGFLEGVASELTKLQLVLTRYMRRGEKSIPGLPWWSSG